MSVSFGELRNQSPGCCLSVALARPARSASCQKSTMRSWLEWETSASAASEQAIGCKCRGAKMKYVVSSFFDTRV